MQYEINILEDSYRALFQRMLEDHNYFRSGAAYFERCFERQAAGDLEIVFAHKGAEAVGYALLNWQPKYALFKTLDIPEVQDLNVVSLHRREGGGRSIIEFCERLASQKFYKEMGIGVGLDSSFGSAQRLYAKMGYVPDGSGVCYDRKQVTAGEFRPIDENLCLMMIKEI